MSNKTEDVKRMAALLQARLDEIERRFDAGEFSRAGFMLCISVRPINGPKDAVFCNCAFGNWDEKGQPGKAAAPGFRILATIPDSMEGVRVFTANEIEFAVAEAKRQQFPGFEVQAVFSRHQTLEWYERIVAIEGALKVFPSM